MAIIHWVKNKSKTDYEFMRHLCDSRWELICQKKKWYPEVLQITTALEIAVENTSRHHIALKLPSVFLLANGEGH